MSAENYLDYPGAKDSLAYRYAKNFLDDPKNSEIMEMSLAETYASAYKTSRPEEYFPSHLIAESLETKEAWDALNLIAQALLRAGQPLPPELAEWIADVLADQSVERKKEKRRPRPARDPRRQHNRNLLLCLLVGYLVRLCDLKATRNDSDPPRSACDVVAAATGLSYKRVEGIWGKRDPILERLFSSQDKESLRKGPFYPHRI